MNNLVLILYSFFYAALNVAGAALIKNELKGMSALNSLQDYVLLLTKWKVITGFFIIFVASLVLFKALSVFEFSKVIPVSIGINFILTAIIGIVIFNESFPLMKLISFSIILIGIILLTVSR